MIFLIGELWNDSAICLSLEWVGLPGYNFAGCFCCLRISFIFEDISISSLCRPGTWSRKTLAVWVQSFCWGFEHLDWNLEGKPTHRSHQAKHQTTLNLKSSLDWKSVFVCRLMVIVDSGSAKFWTIYCLIWSPPPIWIKNQTLPLLVSHVVHMFGKRQTNKPIKLPEGDSWWNCQVMQNNSSLLLQVAPPANAIVTTFGKTALHAPTHSTLVFDCQVPTEELRSLAVLVPLSDKEIIDVDRCQDIGTLEKQHYGRGSRANPFHYITPRPGKFTLGFWDCS